MWVRVRDRNFSPWTPSALKIELSFGEVPVLILPPLNNAGDQLWWVGFSGPSAEVVWGLCPDGCVDKPQDSARGPPL